MIEGAVVEAGAATTDVATMGVATVIVGPAVVIVTAGATPGVAAGTAAAGTATGTSAVGLAMRVAMGAPVVSTTVGALMGPTATMASTAAGLMTGVRILCAEEAEAASLTQTSAAVTAGVKTGDVAAVVGPSEGRRSEAFDGMSPSVVILSKEEAVASDMEVVEMLTSAWMIAEAMPGVILRHLRPSSMATASSA